MIIIISLFYVSLLTVSGMIVWKIASLRNTNVSLVEGVEKELHGIMYDVIHSGWHVFRVSVLTRVRMLALYVFYSSAHAILHFLEIIGKKIKARHGKWFDMVKGKGVIKKKGSVSFFLRNMRESENQ